ncbi:Protein CBG26630 [Caenorhabditis briggsae]|uniref:Uncharacterized protein n=2 Tax=Caenorhabditis briggsae TaxID=6238 RepID=A0AAE9DYQ4_CAEBR|nr:Protein CBG26630 [Caenorhabditis briggsae]ULU13683.1 hypothetical protein L3Y34_016276 [Caenorhabditis briggsae]CAS00780.1 Protein CBG26630 [Caenorhabditis briggsae]
MSKLLVIVVDIFRKASRRFREDGQQENPSTSTNTPSTSNPITTPEHPIFSSYQFFQVDESPFNEEEATPWDVQEVLQKNKPAGEDSEEGQRRLGPPSYIQGSRSSGDSTSNFSMWFHRIEPKDRFQWSGRLEYTDDLMDYEFEKIEKEWTEKKEYAMRRAENLAQLEAKREKKIKETLTRQLKSMKIH